VKSRTTFVLAARAAAAAIALAALTACSNSHHDPLEKYYLVTPNTKAAYWQEGWAGFNHAAFVMGAGVQAALAGPDTFDPQAEVQEFRTVMSLKPTGILVSAGDAAAMKGPIDAAIALGIPVITVDSDVPDSKRLTFIGTNNYQAGVMGGRVLVERLHGKGDIVVYTLAGQVNAGERLRGYKSVLDGHPQIKIVRTVDVKGDPRIAFDSTVEITKGKPIPDGFICLVAVACPEVADVLDRNNIQNKVIVAMDTPSDTLDWIKKGRIAATISQKPYTMGQFGILMLDALHHYKLPRLDANWAQDIHSPFPAFIDTGATLIDQTNLDAFRKAQSASGGGA
jgi:ribose transport system substrate-binding protein